MKKLIYLVVLIMMFCGCATVYHLHDTVFYGTKETSTGVTTHCIGNMNVPSIIGHEITIDDKKTIELQTNSEITILLTPGSHKLKFVTKKRKVSFPVWWLKPKKKIESWGKLIEKEIILNKNEIVNVKFKAAWCKFCEGKLEIARRVYREQ